jgi:drug/metabolite transporter (DMT)-like permease
MVPLTSLFFITVVFRDDKITRYQLIGLGVGLSGVLVVLGIWNGLGPNPWWAVGALLLAVTMYGVTFPYIRRYITPLRLQPVALASSQLIASALTLLPTFLLDGLNGHEIAPKAVVGITALGVFGSGLAFMWNFRSIELLGSSIASTVTYLSPVVATVAGVIFLGEKLDWYLPVGGLIVLFGAAIGQGRIQSLLSRVR